MVDAMKESVLVTQVSSPLGSLTLTGHEGALSGVYFEDHQHPYKGEVSRVENDDACFAAAISWLSHYFSNGVRGPLPELDIDTGTDFQREVWKALSRIPERETRTYAEIAEEIGSPKGVRAVGAAVGRNPISILIPCHRVIGSNGSLTGFAGGLERKRWLLVHEKVLCL